MKKIIIVLIIFAVGWYGYQKNQPHQQEQSYTIPKTEYTEQVLEPTPSILTNNSQFKCDGRTHCSQMTSCEEATFFLRNCPDTKMDGDNDGVPCEKQWCRW
jgi:hypothetical protein